MVSQYSAGKDIPWSACWNFIFMQSPRYLSTETCCHLFSHAHMHAHTSGNVFSFNHVERIWVFRYSWIFGHPVVIRCCDPQGHSNSVGLVVQHWLGEPLSHVLLRFNLDPCQANGSFIRGCVEIPKGELIWKQSLHHFFSSSLCAQIISFRLCRLVWSDL